MHKKERTLEAFWLESSGSKMKDGIAGIKLSANTLNLSEGYVSLTYQFANHDACSEKDKRKEKGSL